MNLVVLWLSQGDYLLRRCETFHHIVAKDGASSSNGMSFYHQGSVTSFGGYRIDEGTQFHYVTCTFDLNESVPIKSGHSVVVTSLSSLAAEPKANMQVSRSVQKNEYFLRFIKVGNA